MENLLSAKEYDFISAKNKAFITAFDEAMDGLGYTSGGQIGNGYCWGRYMVIYTKQCVKSKKSYARVYIQDEGLVLRLYFSNIDKHREAIEHAPAFIREAFTGEFPTCDQCRPACTHRKCYTISGRDYEVCDGRAFWFFRPALEQLPEYLDIFTTFYPTKK